MWSAKIFANGKYMHQGFESTNSWFNSVRYFKAYFLIETVIGCGTFLRAKVRLN